jgi:outer membrane protein assembly factor BamE (lipoprotein component of BamABCDE complex)
MNNYRVEKWDKDFRESWPLCIRKELSMKTRVHSVLLLMLTLCLLWAEASQAGKPLTRSVKLNTPGQLSFNGLGPIRIGMSVSQASRALGVPILTQKYVTPNVNCYYVFPKAKSWEGIGLMVVNYKIVRIDIDTPSINTVSGAHIGMTEKQIKTLYPGIRTEPHHYDDKGHYLIYESNDPLYRPYSLLFETDGQRVYTFRAGYREPVGYVEGCA